MVLLALLGGCVGVAISFEAITVAQAAIVSAILVVVWFVGYLALASFGTRRFNAVSMTAIGMLSRGEIDKAAETWSPWTRGLTVPAVIRAAALHNVAWTILRRGQLREALEKFAANERANLKWLRAIHMHGVSAMDRGLCSALLGDLDAARHALAEGAMRSDRPHQSLPVMQSFVESVIACRDGRAANAARALAERWSEYENLATGDVVRPLRVVRAFAIAAEGPRSAGQVETLVAMVRPSYPTEYEFLAVGWPEMAAFLASHGLR